MRLSPFVPLLVRSLFCQLDHSKVLKLSKYFFVVVCTKHSEVVNFWEWSGSYSVPIMDSHSGITVPVHGFQCIIWPIAHAGYQQKVVAGFRKKCSGGWTRRTCESFGVTGSSAVQMNQITMLGSHFRWWNFMLDVIQQRNKPIRQNWHVGLISR